MSDDHSATPTARAYHYVLTLHAHGREVTAGGIVNVESKETRQDVFARVANEHAQGLAMDRPTVAFWSLEPNDLGEDQ